MSNSARDQLTGGPRQDLLRAAKMVETTAYEIALSRPSTIVSELIVIAAQLDRLAHLVGNEP